MILSIHFFANKCPCDLFEYKCNDTTKEILHNHVTLQQ